MIVKTAYVTTAVEGKGRIVAKGGGKQRTLPYNHSRTPGQNHGDAAGVLLRDAHNWNGATLDDHRVTTIGFNNGTRVFNLEYKVRV